MKLHRRRPPLGRTVLWLSVFLLVASLVGQAPQAGTMAYITNADSDSVSVVDTETAEVVATLPVAGRPIGVAVDRTGSRAYVSNFDSHVVSVIDGTTQTVMATVPVGTNPNGIAVNPAGTRVYVANQGDDTVSVIDAETWQILDTLYLGCSLTIGVAVTPDNSRVYVSCAGEPDAVAVIDAASNAIARVIPLPTGSNPKGVSVAPDGSRVFAALAVSGEVAVIDTATDQVVGILPVDAGPQIAAVHPSGEFIYVTSFTGGTVSIIETGRFETMEVVSMGKPLGVDVTPDGRRIFVADAASSSTQVFVMDATTHAITDVVTVGSRPHAFGKFIRAGSMVVEIHVDIKPGDAQNMVNPRARGRIPVAILGSATFNVADIDATRLTFGPWEASPAHDLSDPDLMAAHLRDVNGDGYTDLLVHFYLAEAGLSCGERSADLQGRTVGGVAFRARDSVTPVGCGGSPRGERPGAGRERPTAGRRL